MDCEKGLGNAGCKGGKVAFKVAEAVRVEEKQQALPANPQLYPYFVFLFLAAYVVSFFITIGPSVSPNKESAFSAHGGIFMIVTIVSLSSVVVASGILILTSHYLLCWMKEIHYAILKSVGCFSATNVLFSLGAAFLVPEDINWNVYVIMSFIFVCFLASDYLLWKFVCTHQQNKLCNTFPLHWTVFLTPLLPLSIAMGPFIPPNLHAMWYGVTWGSLLVVAVAGYFSFIKSEEAKASYLLPLMK